MATIDARDTQTYIDLKKQKIEHFLEQMKEVASSFRSDLLGNDTVEEDTEDAVFAGLLASHLIAYSLRPRAIRNQAEIRSLLEPYPVGSFGSDPELDDIAKIFAESAAIYRGHFELVNRDHSQHFFMFSRLGSRAELRNEISRKLSKRFESLRIDTVAAPVSAGGLLAQDIAADLHCDVAFFEIDHQSRPLPKFKDGYTIRGRTLIVNDLTTTGIGLATMVEGVRNYVGADLVGVGLIAARGNGGREILNKLAQAGLVVEVLANLKISAQKKDSCPLCQMGIPATLSADINR